MRHLWHRIYHFFDKAEDKVRGRLSRTPIIYAFIGGVGIVLFWRGVWLTADILIPMSLRPGSSWYPHDPVQIWDGPITIIVSAVLLLMTGLFVSNFIGNEILISGLRGEKKVTEKTEEELETEEAELRRVKIEEEKELVSLYEIRQELRRLSHEVKKLRQEQKK